MTQQISVRLPDEVVAFLDQVVSDGHASSRATAIASAVAHERQRLRELADIEILTGLGAGGQDELVGIAEKTSRTPLDID